MSTRCMNMPSMKNPSPHIPVLGEAVKQLFSKSHIIRFLDGTVGAGGHAHLLLTEHPEIEQYWAIDQDATALAIAQERLLPFVDKVRYLHSNFSDTAKFPSFFQGILLDVGVSSMQLDQAERGFSFMRDGPLDMRMDQEGNPVRAKDIINRWNPKELECLFRTLGEERRAKKVAEAIYGERKRRHFETTKELADFIEGILGRTGPIHPATKIFQALRIEVNQELAVLQNALKELSEKLAPGGILACITFHSGEDRIVKQEFQKLVLTKEFSHSIKKPLLATTSECRYNPRARSAKLRALMRKEACE